MSADSEAARQEAGTTEAIAVVPDARRDEPGRRRGWAACWGLAALILAAAVLFVVYLRLSNTFPEDSDQANLGLQAQEMLHGNLLLHGWTLSDTSFYTTELPQYMLLELFLGLNTGMFHAAAAMTYTLALLLAALLAKGGATGRRGMARVLVAGGIMLAPQLGSGVMILLGMVGHIGTSVPLLLIWLVLDRMRARWYLPVVTGVLLAWAAVGDSLVLALGVAPLVLVCAVRVVQGLLSAARARGSGASTPRAARVRRELRSRWLELSLAGAALAAAATSRAVIRAIRANGGFGLHAVTFQLEPVSQWAGRFTATWHGVLQLFGADATSQSPGTGQDFAFLHLVGVALVVIALLLASGRFLTRLSLVDQLLAVAVAVNIVAYLTSSVGMLNAHEMAVVLPAGAALTGRMLVARQRSARAGRIRLLRPSRYAGWARAAMVTVGALVLAGYLAGLGVETAHRPVPAAKTGLASWLAAHRLFYGLGGYWEASIVTVDSGGRVKVRALAQPSLVADMWEAKGSWYDPRAHRATFIVLDSQPGFLNYWEPVALVRRDFGVPSRTYQFAPYTVLVWDKNLLTSISR